MTGPSGEGGNSESALHATRGPETWTVVKDLASLFAPVTILTALLYFFGYTRERAFWGYFGADPGTVGYGTTDYIVRSVSTVFAPLTRLLGVIGVCLVVHIALRLRLSAHHRESAGVAAVAAAVGAVLLCIGVLGVGTSALDAWATLFGPIALGFGAVFLEYASYVTERYAVGTNELPVVIAETKLWRRGILGLVIVAALFASTADLAHAAGQHAAEKIARTLPIQTQVIVYSRHRLQIAGPKVGFADLNNADAAYAYRYNGLRLLVHNDNRWLLLPAGWKPLTDCTPGQNCGTLVILTDSPQDMRVEVAP